MKKIVCGFMLILMSVGAWAVIESSGATKFSVGKSTILSDNVDVKHLNRQDKSINFTLHSLISDNVVFQQGKKIRIFGEAGAGTRMFVSLAKDEGIEEVYENDSVANAGGLWEIELPELDASYDKYTLTVTDGKNVIKVNNCLIGEVWVMSGQSNMELKVSEMKGGKKLMGDVNEDYVRIFYQERVDDNFNFPYEPQYDVRNGHWLSAVSGENISESSAIGFIFAKNMREKFYNQGEEVPVAIINAHKGGSKIQSWLPRNTVVDSEEITKFVTDKFDTNGNRYGVGEEGWNEHGWDNYNQVSALYNQKLSPLTNFSIKGVVWYQGESDPEYKPNVFTIKALIDSWSWVFNRSDELLNFALIQLHPFNNQDPFSGLPTNYGVYRGFADHRRAQFDVVNDPKYKNSVQLIPIYDVSLEWETSSDIYPWKDPIHPLDKQPVGERLSKVTMNAVYRNNTDYLAPMVDTLVIEEGEITLSFSHVGPGLKLFKSKGNGVTTVAVSNKIGQRKTVSAEIISHNEISIKKKDLDLLHVDINDVVAVSYSDLSRNEQSNLAGGYDIPVIPFVVETGNSGSGQVKQLEIFIDEITDWKLSTGSAHNITERVVTDNELHGAVIEHHYWGNRIVSDFVAGFVMDLSDYKGGTLEFDMKIVSQPESNNNAEWFIKVDCGWPCGTGDVPLNASKEGIEPTPGHWQHYTFDVDYLLSLPGGTDPGSLPLDISSVVSPLIVFPVWGDNQEGAVFRIDNIVYKPAVH